MTLPVELRRESFSSRKTIHPTITKANLQIAEVIKLCEARGIRATDSKGKTLQVYKFVASDESVDRYGDIINQAGWKLEQFKKNPVILWQHAHLPGPIGMAVKEELVENKNGSGKKLVVHFVIHDITKTAQEARELLDAGMIRASSVGFNPIKFKDLTPEEKQELGMGPWGAFFEEQELVELSLVSVPANGNALDITDEKDYEGKLIKGLLEGKDFLSMVIERLSEKLPEIVDLKGISSKVEDLATKIAELSSEIKKKDAEINLLSDQVNPELTPEQFKRLIALTTEER